MSNFVFVELWCCMTFFLKSAHSSRSWSPGQLCDAGTIIWIKNKTACLWKMHNFSPAVTIRRTWDLTQHPVPVHFLISAKKILAIAKRFCYSQSTIFPCSSLLLFVNNFLFLASADCKTHESCSSFQFQCVSKHLTRVSRNLRPRNLRPQT